MLHVSLTSFGVVRGTSRELVEAAASLLALEAQLNDLELLASAAGQV